MLCSGAIGCARGSVPPENACTPWAGGSAPPDEPSGCAPGEPGETAPDSCSVAADDPSPLAEGTDGCGAGWSSPPRGCPLKTTNATKRRTAPNATAVRLTRSPQRSASPTVTASCSAASFCGPGGDVVRRARPVDNTARLDPPTVPVKPSVPPRRPGQQNDAVRHEAVRAGGPGGDVVRRARPVDSAARLRRGGR